MNAAEGLLREYVKTLGSVAALYVAFSLVELLLPAERGQRFGRRLFNSLYLPFVVAFLFVVQVPFAPLYAWVLDLAGGGLLGGLVTPRSGWAAQCLFAVAFAFVWDLWQYWIHRLQHAVPVLWQTHRFHHSETAFNSSTQARHHALHYLVLLAAYPAILIVFGPQLPHAVAAFVLFRLWGFVNHVNARIELGPFAALLAGPQWHRIHHSLLPEHQGRNFATFFPAIDVLFGTYYAPRRGECPPTGLPDEESDGTLREATITPFQAGYRALAVRLGRRLRPASALASAGTTR